MPEQITRRETLRRGWTVTSLLALAPDWATRALAEGDTDVPFSDIPATFTPNNPKSTTRMLDIRKIDGLFTPKDQFFAVQHLGRPEIDPATYRLRFTGMVNKAAEFSVADLRAMRSTDVAAGYECSGNRGRSMQGLSSCGRFTVVGLSGVRDQLTV